MSSFATVEDIVTLWRPLTAVEITKANALLPLVSDELRILGEKVGKDIDAMVAESTSYGSVVKIVTVDVVTRVLRQNTTGEAMTQESQAGLGYSWSGTYAVPGGGIANAIMRNDMKKLGLCSQTIGAVKLWGNSQVNQ